MTLSTRDRQKMIQAKDLIGKKHYQDAYDLIHDIDHPTAKKWRTQLALRLDEGLGNPFEEPVESQKNRKSVSKDQSKKPRKKRRKTLYIALVGFLLFMFLLAMMESGEQIQQEAIQLKFYDSANTGAINADGSQWNYRISENNEHSLVVSTTAYNSASDALTTPDLTDVALHTTLLFIRCTPERYEAFFTADSQLRESDGRHLVALVFDNDPSQTVGMTPSVNGTSAFVSEGSLSNLFAELSQSGELAVMMPTISGLYRFSEYDISGFKNAVQPLIEHCGSLP